MAEQDVMQETLERLIERMSALEDQIQILTQCIRQLQFLPSTAAPQTAAAGTATSSFSNWDHQQWLMQERRWYNRMMNSEPCEEMPLIISKHAKTWKGLETVSFASRELAAADPSYALLSPNRQGRCIAVPFGTSPQGETLYAAFPNPLNTYWYEDGKALIERLYTIEGNASSYAPQLYIKDLAILQRRKDASDDPTSYEYFLTHRGYVRIRN